MKKNDITALKQRPQAELLKELATLQGQLAKARVEKKAGKLANFALPSRLADDIARIKTVLTAQEIEG